MAERMRQANQVGGRPVRRVLRLTEAENAELSIAARRADRTVQRFVVESAIARVRGTDPEVARETIAAVFGMQHQLAKVGTNINQIARHANATGGEILRAELSEELATLRRLLGKVDDVLESVSLEAHRG